MFVQFIVGMLASLSFAVLFSAPKKQLIFCGLTGAIGWVVYLLCLNLGTSVSIANMTATFALTLISRSIASLRKTPVTVYLVIGIFPLVPGAGIYYTSYHFMMNEMIPFSQAASDTLKTAGAIALGIAFGFALPQSWFHALQRLRFRR